MESSTINPSAPKLTGLNWRPISSGDLDSLVELAHICLKIDGGLSLLFEADFLKTLYFPDEPDGMGAAGTGAFDSDGRLVACAALNLVSDSSAPWARLVGLVRPDFRNQGIGTYLIQWGQAQFKTMQSNSPEKVYTLRIATESLTEEAHQLYQAHGFKKVFEELVMRKELHLPITEHSFPPDSTIVHWQPEYAQQFYQAYETAFRERPGFPGWSSAQWIGYVTEDGHVPEWSLLARVNGAPAGFVIGNLDLTTTPPDGYIWQIGVVPSQRRHGLASALITETMRRMQASGANAVQLTVHINNPGAIETYTRLGFKTVGRRARYEHTTQS